MTVILMQRKLVSKSTCFRCDSCKCIGVYSTYYSTYYRLLASVSRPFIRLPLLHVTIVTAQSTQVKCEVIEKTSQDASDG